MTTIERIAETLATIADLPQADAERLARAYVDAGCVRIDPVNGSWSMTPGDEPLLDRENILIAFETVRKLDPYNRSGR